jgi:hypothetical protein
MKTLTNIMNFLSGVSDTIDRGIYPMLGVMVTIIIVYGLMQPFVENSTRTWGMWGLLFVGAFFIGKLRNNNTKD